MSVPNGERLATKQDLADMYQEILPYLGGKADAGFTPVGTVISVMGVTAPANYLACDGTVYNISDYPELARYFGQQFNMVNTFGGDGTTTFAVPDLRGEFLRGTGSNSHSGNGNGANVGTHQDATVLPWYRSNSATVDIMNSTTSGVSVSISNQDSTKQTQTGTPQWSRANRDSTATTGLTSDSFTVRPTNTSVLWCIATKNIYLDPKNDYSTEEKVIGTWITGETLYQKTFDVPAPQVVTDKTVATSFAEIGATIDKAFIINATMITASGAVLPLPTGTASVIKGTSPTQYVDAQVFVHVFTNKSSDANLRNKVRVSNQATSYNTASFYVTIQYTKTP